MKNTITSARIQWQKLCAEPQSFFKEELLLIFVAALWGFTAIVAWVVVLGSGDNTSSNVATSCMLTLLFALSVASVFRGNAKGTVRDRRDLLSYIILLFVIVLVMMISRSTGGGVPEAAAALAAITGGAKTIKILITSSDETAKEN